MTNDEDVGHSIGGPSLGATVFAGTRVPVDTLFDYLAAGETLDEFLKQFPTVSRDQAIALLERAKIKADAEATAV